MECFPFSDLRIFSLYIYIYINDLLNNLHHTNPNAVKLTNDVKLICLAYADVIIIISHSALGLQACLDCLDKFCKVWKMIINTTKTKCITFQKKNKLNKTELFTVGNCILSNVCEFTYLGIKINASGSFRSSPKFLGENANRACFALNNHLKVRDIPVVIALKLFDATVLPILTYGAEVWAAFERDKESIGQQQTFFVVLNLDVDLSNWLSI